MSGHDKILAPPLSSILSAFSIPLRVHVLYALAELTPPLQTPQCGGHKGPRRQKNMLSQNTFLEQNTGPFCNFYFVGEHTSSSRRPAYSIENLAEGPASEWGPRVLFSAGGNWLPPPQALWVVPRLSEANKKLQCSDMQSSQSFGGLKVLPLHALLSTVMTTQWEHPENCLSSAPHKSRAKCRHCTQTASSEVILTLDSFKINN